MDLSQYREQLNRDGFVVVRGFLSPAALGELRSELDRFVLKVVPTLPETDAFYEDRTRPTTLKQLSRMEQDGWFEQLSRTPTWMHAAESLLGEQAVLHGVEWFNKPAGTNHITPPHQDNFYFCLQPPQVLTMWLALDEIDEENGCLRYVRGSHLRGVRNHSRTKTLGFSQGIVDFGAADKEQEAAIMAQPGDLLIHHGNTIHRAEANRSAKRERRSFAIVYRGVSCQRDEVALARYREAVRAQHAEIGLTA